MYARYVQEIIRSTINYFRRDELPSTNKMSIHNKFDYRW